MNEWLTWTAVVTRMRAARGTRYTRRSERRPTRNLATVPETKDKVVSSVLSVSRWFDLRTVVMLV